VPGLRKGRDRCTATRRDGRPCRAPAIAGGLVCRRHGGQAPQVQIAAKHHRLQLALWVANREFEEAAGTSGRFDALCKYGQAARALSEYEAKLDYLAELRAELRKRKAATRDQAVTVR
jgi:hypothetical protein